MGGSITGRGWAILLSALTLAQAFPAAAPEAPPVTGTWYIDGDVTLEDGTFYLNADVLVNFTGSLSVIDSVLVINASNVLLSVYGGLRLENTRVIAGAAEYRGQVVLDTYRAEFSNSSFTNLSWTVRGTANFTSCGFSGPRTNIYASSYGQIGYGIVLNNCTFMDIEGNSIYSVGGGMAVLGCRFFHRASDWVDTGTGVEEVEAPKAGVRVLDNELNRLGRGMALASVQSSYDTTTIVVDAGYQGAYLVRNTTFVGVDQGMKFHLIQPSRDIQVEANRFLDCKQAIDVSYLYSESATVSGNIIERGQDGIVVHGGRSLVANNTISNCSRSGFYGYRDRPADQIPIIRDNRVTGCPFGAYLMNVNCEFRSNDVSGCAYAGVFSKIDHPYYTASYYSVFEDNAIANCGLLPDPTYRFSSALWAISYGTNNRIAVSGNRLKDNPGIGIYMDGAVSVDNNTIENSTVGIKGWQRDPSNQEVRQNRIRGGETGIHLGAAAPVIENDLSDLGTGIICDIQSGLTDLQVANNAIHSCERGIIVRNPLGGYWCATISGNVVAASIDGVLVDSVSAAVNHNDFGGTFGYCVHAIGQEPSVSSNHYGLANSGQLLQEWYLQVQALELPNPDSTRWYLTNRFSARIRNETGALAFSGDSGGSWQVRANLTGYVLDRESRRTNHTRYDLAVMKPHVGVGSAAISMFENAGVDIQLFPRADLAVQDILLPAGRPVAGRSAEVLVTVVHDTTYDIYFNHIGAVGVSLLGDGVPLGEGRIERLEPNATATVRFTWYVPGGLHALAGLVDPDRRIPEAFEDNNRHSLLVAANDAPQPALSVSDPAPSVGRPVAFCSDGSTDDTGVARSLFDFGDGTDSGWTSDSTALHVYGAPGIYSSRLRVADDDGVESDWGPPLAVPVTEGPLEVSLSSNTTAPETLAQVLFSVSTGAPPGRQHSFAWSFGDGSSELGRAPSLVHAFSRPGTYVVAVTVTDPLGRSGSATIQLSVRNRAPEASVAFSPSSPTVLTPVRFRQVAGDPDGVVVRWRWDLGDGNRSADPEPLHVYQDKGAYTVTLEVQDDSGAWSAPAVERLTVHNIGPAARATSDSAAVRAGEPVRLDAGLSADPDDRFRSLSFLWSSADGWSAPGQNASRRFASPGLHRITLTVTDGSGASSQDTVTVQVLPAEEAGSPRYREIAISLSVSAVAVFLVALAIYGRDRTGKAAARTPSGRPARRGGGAGPRKGGRS